MMLIKKDMELPASIESTTQEDTFKKETKVTKSGQRKKRHNSQEKRKEKKRRSNMVYG